LSLTVKNDRTSAGIALVAVLTAGTAYAQTPEISEFLAVNDGLLLDSDRDDSDWIEVRNPGPGSLNVEGWHLTDDALNPTKWTFPDLELAEDAHLVVFASGKNRTNTDVVDPVDGTDSSAFEHRLEFNVDGVLPTQEGAADGWTQDGFNIGAGAAPPRLSVANGVLSFDTMLGGQWSLINDAAWADDVGPETSWTFEARIRVLSTAGSTPGATLWLANGAERIILRIEEDRIVTWSGDLLHQGDNSASFVDVRVAYDAANGGYDVWRDGVLVGDHIGDEGSDSRRSIFLIDCCSSVQVAGELDHVRWDAGGVFPPDGQGGGGLPELHTDFNLSSEGEYLALVAPDGTTVATEFSPRYPEQRRNVSFGADGFFPTPTPGAPNGDSVAGFVEAPAFGVERGFFETPLDVEIETGTAGATIRYTTDSSKPSPTHGTVYTDAVRVDTTTPLRAVAYRDGFFPSKVVTHTYVFLDDVLRQTGAGFPANADWDYAMDPNVVENPRFSGDMLDDLRSLPTLSLVLPKEDMFGPGGIHANPTRGGAAWERETSVEWIPKDESPSVQVDCGVRIQGAGSRFRDLGKKSFRLAFRSEYGFSKLRAPVLGDDATNEFDDLVLRGNYFDSWTVHVAGNGESIGWQAALMLRDAFAFGSQRATGHTSLHDAWAHLYIDGLYWGIYNVTERPDEKFAASYFGGSPDDYDVLKQRPRGSANGSLPELVSGDRVAWNELVTLVKRNIASPAVYAQVEERLAMDSFIDYLILNLWGGNQDWPHNNWYAIRNSVAGEPFHFISWDAENFVFLLSEAGKLNTSVDNSPGILYSRLRRNEEFRVRFGDRVHRHLFHDGAFTPERASERFQLIVDEIVGAMDPESARWGDTRIEPPRNTIDQFLVTVDDKIGRYFPQRTRIVLDQFRGIGLYPDLEAPRFNQHGGPIDAGFALNVQSPAGEVYFTLSGEDPRLPGGAVSPNAIEAGSQGIVILASGAPARALVPTDGSLGLSWTGVDFVDSTWDSGTTGVGYERSSGYEELIGLDVESDAFDVNESVYMRVPFELDADPASIVILTLRMRFDDGFVAFLNGTEIARRNAPEDATWNSGATRGHTDSQAIVFENIDISAEAGSLRAGSNVLAIHGMNAGANSSDFLFLPELVAVESSSSGVILDRTTLVKSRAVVDEEWSALNEAVFVVDEGLRVTEIMYHPAPPPDGDPRDQDEFEFVELENTGDGVIDLEGVRFVEGVKFDFTDSAVTTLRPGEVVVVVENVQAFASRHDLARILVAGEYIGKLSNRGERIRLVGLRGETLHDFVFDDAWHPATDGSGPSLEIVDLQAPLGTWSDRDAWRTSDADSGTPGVSSSTTSGERQLPGDLNRDGRLDVSDAVSLLGHLFAGSPEVLPCGDGSATADGNRALLDSTGDGGVDLSDAVHVLNYLFQGGPRPALGSECVQIPTCPEGCRG